MLTKNRIADYYKATPCPFCGNPRLRHFGLPERSEDCPLCLAELQERYADEIDIGDGAWLGVAFALLGITATILVGIIVASYLVI